jgi:hypothetical protein
MRFPAQPESPRPAGQPGSIPNPYSPPPGAAAAGYGPPPGYRPDLKPHRGAAVLTLGILGLVVCVVCGIIAWVMGSQDLNEMAMGQMDRSGEGMTRAGKICGMISVILGAVVLVIYLLVVAIFIGAKA